MQMIYKLRKKYNLKTKTEVPDYLQKVKPVLHTRSVSLPIGKKARKVVRQKTRTNPLNNTLVNESAQFTLPPIQGVSSPSAQKTKDRGILKPKGIYSYSLVGYNNYPKF